MDSATAYIGLGSNLGDRRANLDAAIDALERADDVTVRRISSYHETPPMGPSGQGPYLNAAAEIETRRTPEDLLSLLHGIEAGLGRDRRAEQRWGPRTCDLDLLLYGDVVTAAPELTVPHPGMHERRFVLAPLTEIAPDVLHPVLNKTIAELLADLESEL